LRKLITLSTVALITFFSCGGGGGGGSSSSGDTTSTSTSAEVSTSATESQTREVPMNGRIEKTRSYSLDGVNVAYAVATTVDNGTPKSYGTEVSEEGTFTFPSVLAGRRYALSFFDENGNPIVSTITRGIEVDSPAEVLVVFADSNGDGVYDDALVSPVKGAKVFFSYFHDQDGDKIPDEVEDTPAFDGDGNGVPDVIESYLEQMQQLHQQLEEQVENQTELNNQQPQGENQTEEQVGVNPEEIERVVSDEYFQRYVDKLPYVLAGIKVLHSDGIGIVDYWEENESHASNNTLTARCSVDGNVSIRKIDTKTYEAAFFVCSATGFSEMSGKLIITVEDEAKDKVKVKVVDGIFLFKDDNGKRYELSSGTSAEFEGEKRVKVLSFNGTVNAFNLVFSNLNFSGEFDNVDKFKVENAHFTGSFETSLGKVKNYSFDLNNMSVSLTHYVDESGKQHVYEKSGNGTLKADDYQFEVEYSPEETIVYWNGSEVGRF